MKLRLRDFLTSAVVLGIVLAGLVSIDERVNERFRELVTGTGDLPTLGARASELFGAISSAARYQSIENAPMLLFATVGAVLFLAMLRS